MEQTGERNLSRIVELGHEWYDRRVKPNITAEDDGKFVAIDVHTGDYEIDSNPIPAVDRLRGRQRNPEVYITRVGRRVAFKYAGGRDDRDS